MALKGVIEIRLKVSKEEMFQLLCRAAEQKKCVAAYVREYLGFEERKRGRPRADNAK
jgi:hypothetical protein